VTVGLCVSPGCHFAGHAPAPALASLTCRNFKILPSLCVAMEIVKVLKLPQIYALRRQLLPAFSLNPRGNPRTQTQTESPIPIHSNPNPAPGRQFYCHADCHNQWYLPLTRTELHCLKFFGARFPLPLPMLKIGSICATFFSLFLRFVLPAPAGRVSSF